MHRRDDGIHVRGVERNAGGNCIKIGLPGKLILSKRKGLLEVLFSYKYSLGIDFPGSPIFIQLPPGGALVLALRHLRSHVSHLEEDLLQVRVWMNQRQENASKAI